MQDILGNDWLHALTPERRRELDQLLHDSTTEKVEWILSCDAKFINEFLGFGHGINTGISLGGFLHAGADAISYRRRRGLEVNPDQRHLISYDLFCQFNEAGDDIEVVYYGRTKFSGEQKLVNSHSAGVGGHLDWFDQAQDPRAKGLDAPRVLLSVGEGISRERLEEILLKARDGKSFKTAQEVKEALSPSSFLGFLCDNEDPKKTGDFHVGLVSVVLLPRGWYGVINDKSNVALPARPLRTVLDDPKAERWTVMVAEFFERLPGGLKQYIENHFFTVVTDAP